MNIAKCFNIVVILNNYNKYDFIQRCLLSILDQTYKNFTLVIVDDHSDDGSFEIISNFASANSGIVVIRNTQNLGISESRNVGLDYCLSSYDLDDTFVLFVDSDDYLQLDFLSNIVDIIQNNECDIVCSSIFYTYTNCFFPHILTEEDKLINSFDATHTLLLDMKIPSWFPSKAFRLSLFRDVSLPRERVSYEDRFTAFKLFNKSNYVYLTKYIGYYYWQEDLGSITRSKITNKKIMDSLDAYYESVEYVYSEDKKINKVLQTAAFNAFIQNALSAIVYYDKKKASKDELIRFKKYRRMVNFITVLKYNPPRKKFKKKKYYYLLLGPFYKCIYLRYKNVN